MIPRWIPQDAIGGWVLLHPGVREDLEAKGLRYICRSFHQDIEFWVPLGWWRFAQIEHWYWKHEWWLYQLALRLGFLLGEEGDLYSNHRWTWRFWLGIEQRAYRRGVREASIRARRAKAEWRRGRRHGFFLGGDYYRRAILRSLRSMRSEIRDIRSELESQLP
jgi:hypothetical protein